MFFSFDRIKEVATPVGSGWGKARIELAQGDTAFMPGTTKYQFQAHKDGAWISYWITPDGMVEIGDDGYDGVHRNYIERDHTMGGE